MGTVRSPQNPYMGSWGLEAAGLTSACVPAFVPYHLPEPPPQPERTGEFDAFSFLRERMGSSRHVQSVFGQVNLVAPTEFTVIVYGESGSGKELIAQAIHKAHNPPGAPFIPVDCGSMPSTLIESALFGHEKGSFTGAERMRLGKFEAAAGGTLFLDEICNLPMDLQPKLLRALQEKEIWRVGGEQPVEVRTRLIVASNQDLLSLVGENKFRRDLYHRLNEFCIPVPALRERIEDLLYLCRRFIALTNEELHKEVSGLSNGAAERLLAHSWPGNVRELRNVIRRAVLIAEDWIEPEHLSLTDAELPPVAEPAEDAGGFDGTVPFKEYVQRAVMGVERKVLLRTLAETHGNKAEAARRLKLDYKTIQNKVKHYGIVTAPGGERDE